jgi:hypothetical protein
MPFLDIETYASSWKTTLDGRGFTGQVDHFFECVEKRQQPQTSAWDSVETQLLLEQMLTKAEYINYKSGDPDFPISSF